MEEGLATNRREAGLNLNLAKQKRSFHAQVGHWAADIFQNLESVFQLIVRWMPLSREAPASALVARR